MLCDECKKKSACVHITTIIGDKKTERHFCEDCAPKSGELNITQKLHNLFGAKAADHLHGFIKELSTCGEFEEASRNTLCCKECGLTQFEFGQSGKLGCSACYSVFEDDLEALLGKVHGSVEHKGKIARKSLASVSVQEKIENLRLKIKNHVSHEEYEQAAIIRDEIRSLEAEFTAATEKEEYK
jgi:protein arginine kinase activator